jgi:hypothetical protein
MKRGDAAVVKVGIVGPHAGEQRRRITLVLISRPSAAMGLASNASMNPGDDIQT